MDFFNCLLLRWSFNRNAACKWRCGECWRSSAFCFRPAVFRQNLPPNYPFLAMNLHIAVRRGGRKWRAEAWLECSQDSQQFFEQSGWVGEVVAVLEAPAPWWLNTLTSHASFAPGGYYDDARGTRISKYSVGGEISKRFYECVFKATSRQKIRLRQLIGGVFLIGSREQIDQFVAQSREYVSGLEVRTAFENQRAAKDKGSSSTRRLPYRNKIK